MPQIPVFIVGSLLNCILETEGYDRPPPSTSAGFHPRVALGDIIVYTSMKELAFSGGIFF
jgi:hypothetical protein